MKTVILFTTLLFTNPLAAEVPTKQVCFNVEGMTCPTCPITVRAAIKKLAGIKSVETSFDYQNANVLFNPQLTSISEIKKAIDDVGYKASEKQCKL